MPTITIDITHGTGYRVGETDRVLGATTPDPDGFTVLNLTNNKIFVADGGVWTDGGTFPSVAFTQDQYDEWVLS
jgi:hypothetical protein